MGEEGKSFYQGGVFAPPCLLIFERNNIFHKIFFEIKCSIFVGYFSAIYIRKNWMIWF